MVAQNQVRILLCRVVCLSLCRCRRVCGVWPVCGVVTVLMSSVSGHGVHRDHLICGGRCTARLPRRDSVPTATTRVCFFSLCTAKESTSLEIASSSQRERPRLGSSLCLSPRIADIARRRPPQFYFNLLTNKVVVVLIILIKKRCSRAVTQLFTCPSITLLVLPLKTITIYTTGSIRSAEGALARGDWALHTWHASVPARPPPLRLRRVPAWCWPCPAQCLGARRSGRRTDHETRGEVPHAPGQATRQLRGLLIAGCFPCHQRRRAARSQLLAPCITCAAPHRREAWQAAALQPARRRPTSLRST